MRRVGTALLLILIVATACRPTERPEKLPPPATPVPEASVPLFPEHPINPKDLSPKDVRTLLSGPMMQRYNTPGRVRWVVDSDDPVSDIRWSPLKGFSVSTGKQAVNITSRGELRWRQTAGLGHRLLSVDGLEAVWSPAFSRIAELGRRGMTGWIREWDGGVIGDERGVFLFDASTVAALGADGKDKWRISLAGIRKLEGPFYCRDAAVFQGMSGLKRQAVEVSMRGAVIRVTELNRGARLLAVDNACNPLVWREGNLSLLGDRGISRWRRDYPNAPLVSRLTGGYLVIASRAARPAVYEIISDTGKTVSRGTLPVSGRLFRAEVITAYGLDVQAIGFCLDVTHPCAEPNSNRGPYNALVTADGNGAFRPLLRYSAGHLGAARIPEGGFFLAGSKSEDATDLELRGSAQEVVWQLTLPGRMSAGPYLGPYGGVYIGVCSGRSCKPPYRLFSITARPYDDDDDTDDN